MARAARRTGRPLGPGRAVPASGVAELAAGTRSG